MSVDLIVRNNNKVLLGKRVNRPAQGYWFTLGGRILKNENINNAIKRIAKIELALKLKTTPYFIGVFEHIYEDGVFNGVSTHYVNLGYEIEIGNIDNLPEEQHNEYKWFEIDELMNSNEVHPYVKDYFTKELGTIPQ